MAGKVSGILRMMGFILCLLCTAYMLYIAVSRRVVEALEMSGEKTFIVAGMVAVAEGEVVRVGDGRTVIRYYHEWDGTEYQSVENHVSTDYPEKAKVPVVYSVGMGAGSCLTVGLYRKPVQILGMAGAFLFLLGLLIPAFKCGGAPQSGA